MNPPSQSLLPKSFWLSLALILTVLAPFILMSHNAGAQEGALDKSEPKDITVQEVIKRFSTKEKEFKEARDHYTYRQDVKVMTLDGDTPDGNYQQVFDVAPKQIAGKKRYFQGRIWVDNHDFQIVKTLGKTVPDNKKKRGQENLFPKFTTWREQVDGQYWFPTYTRAEDTLEFSGGGVKIREIIKYTNYRRFGSKSKITYEGQEVKKAEPSTDQKPQ